MTTWTQEQSINFECARDANTHLMAIYSAESYNEEKKVLPMSRWLPTCALNIAPSSAPMPNIKEALLTMTNKLQASHGENKEF